MSQGGNRLIHDDTITPGQSLQQLFRLVDVVLRACGPGGRSQLGSESGRGAPVNQTIHFTVALPHLLGKAMINNTKEEASEVECVFQNNLQRASCLRSMLP